MKIKSNLVFNTHLHARHTEGSSVPERITIPAGSTLTLPDEEWGKFAESAKGLLMTGNLELLEAPKLSEEEQAAADEAAVAEAEEVLAKLKPKEETSSKLKAASK